MVGSKRYQGHFQTHGFWGLGQGNLGFRGRAWGRPFRFLGAGTWVLGDNHLGYMVIIKTFHMRNMYRFSNCQDSSAHKPLWWQIASKSVIQLSTKYWPRVSERHHLLTFRSDPSLAFWLSTPLPSKSTKRLGRIIVTGTQRVQCDQGGWICYWETHACNKLATMVKNHSQRGETQLETV